MLLDLPWLFQILASIAPAERPARVAATGVEDTVRRSAWQRRGRNTAGVLSRTLDRVNTNGAFVPVLGSGHARTWV